MPKPVELVSSRLRLVALTPELAERQISDRMGFFDALGVEPEPGWPPELMDEAAMRWTRDRLAAHPGDVGWYAWVYISPVMHRLLGTGGFKGAPDADGQVEIGYSMLTSYREQGLATEGVNALIEWAYRDPRVKRIVAHTRDDRDASHRVLEKAGFVQQRRFHDEAEGTGVIAWSHDRDRLAA
jgi:RimJ/RimL family protein N-acetyltransferase